MNRFVPVAVALVLGSLALIPIFHHSHHDDAQDRHALSDRHGDHAQPLSAPITMQSTDEQKLGYSLGYLMGMREQAAISQLKQAVPGLNPSAFESGKQAGMDGKPQGMTIEQMQQTIQTFAQKHQQEEEQKQQQNNQQSLQQSVVNTAEEAKFLADNTKKSGVVTTASGLQYEVLKAGTGAKPKATDSVKVNYEGKLLNGKVFDSTAAHGGTPATFVLNQVIPAWTEGVQLMHEGAKYRFYVPAKLGYGATGAGESIPPNSTLIFDVELLKVNP